MTNSITTATEAVSTAKTALADAQAKVENLESTLNVESGKDPQDAAAIAKIKGELKTAKVEERKATTALTKAEKALTKATEKAEAAAKAAEAKAAAKAEREAKAAQREADRKAAKEKREAERMPEMNGVRRPKPDTKCGQVWGIADKLSEKLGSPTPVAPVLEQAEAAGLNVSNAKAEYARWRKFHGITGRITAPKSEEPAKPSETNGATGAAKPAKSAPKTKAAAPEKAE